MKIIFVYFGVPFLQCTATKRRGTTFFARLNYQEDNECSTWIIKEKFIIRKNETVTERSIVRNSGQL